MPSTRELIVSRLPYVVVYRSIMGHSNAPEAADGWPPCYDGYRLGPEPDPKGT